MKKNKKTKKSNNMNKKTANKEKGGDKISGEKKKLKPMTIVSYTFFISLMFSIIFGIQTNMNFFIPFVIVFIITIVCMGIILVNAIYSKIKKNMEKTRKDN